MAQPVLVRWLHVLALIAIAALGAALLSACGGGGDDDDGGIQAPGGAADINDDDDDSEGDSSDDNGSDDEGPVPGGSSPGSKMAVVTIGDERFEFDMSIVCLSLGGAVAGSGRTADGAVELNIDIPPEDWETSDDDGWDAPSIRVHDERDPSNDRFWEAKPELGENDERLVGKSQVDSFDVDGSRATGTATFMDMREYNRALSTGPENVEPSTGTFDVDCG